MKVLFAASEVSPIIKIGGLGDVIGSLPKALEKLGVFADVIVPYFPSARTEKLDIYHSMNLTVPFNNETVVVEVYKTKLPNSNVGVFLLKNAQYFSTGGSNFFAKTVAETEMFVFFDKCVVEFIKAGLNTYDIIHCNDWHTGMITHLLQEELAEYRPLTLFTIHNLMYQGVGSEDMVRELGIAPGEHPLIDWDIADGSLNMMQQGITSSDYVNAVSPNYAKEILTEEFGGDFADILKAREARLSGILNGLDYSFFPREFTADNWKKGKADSKKKLIEKLGLRGGLDTPLYSFVGRIDPGQKGIDLILNIIPKIVAKKGMFVLLGTGLPEWENKLVNLAKKDEMAGHYSCVTKFDIDLANLIYSGSDFLTVPSKYEPCGLIQMIAVWYGTLPIVHDVGGLRDTITEEYNGFTFKNYSQEDFMNAVDRSMMVYKNHNKLDKLVVNAMNSNFDWEASAKKYLELYNKIVELKK